MLPKGFLRAVEEIRREEIRGASWCAWRAASALLDLAAGGRLDPQAAENAARLVGEANRSMASLYNVARLFLDAYRAGGAGAAAEAMRMFLDYRSRSSDRIAHVAQEILGSGSAVATISYSSNVEGILKYAGDALARVYVAESRPGGEGVALARSLRSRGINAMVVPDAAIHTVLVEVDMVLVGADTVTLEPCLINKVGTLPLALAAREARVPVVAVFEAYKIHPKASCNDVELVRRPYLDAPYGMPEVPIFDRIPGRLVSLQVSEYGIERFGSEELRRVYERFLEEVSPTFHRTRSR